MEINYFLNFDSIPHNIDFSANLLLIDHPPAWDLTIGISYTVYERVGRVEIGQFLLKSKYLDKNFKSESLFKRRLIKSKIEKK